MKALNSWQYLKRIYLPATMLLIGIASFAQPSRIRVAAVGNSVTYGYGLENAKEASYPALLQKMLGESFTVQNFGHSGATLLKKGHNPYYKTKAFSDAIAFKPDIAVIHLGLNDTDPRNWPNYKDDFEPDYAWLIDTFKQSNPHIKIFICRLTPIFSGHPRFKSGTRDWFWQIQELIPGIATSNEVSLIDLHTPLYHRPDLFADNLHPDKEGTAIIAKTVYQHVSGDFGALKTASIFSDNMVLQRMQPIPVYGTANAGDKVEVTFQEKKLSTITDQNGRWKIVFPAMKHGGPYEMKVQSNDAAILFKNVLIGDVWLCSGQSNMEFPLKSAETGKEELNHLPVNSSLRLLKLNSLRATDNSAWDSIALVKTNQLQFFSGSWKNPDASAVENFSAIAYYFGKKIQQEENIPVGLVEIAVGGSPIESWIDRFTMEHDPVLVDMLNNWRKSDFIMEWCRQRADTNLKNAIAARQRHPYEPAYNYEAGIDSLTLFPIKGVIWYQGESNAHNIELYEHLFPVMVRSWRQKWGTDFPFYYVQLSGIDRPSWPGFRNAQRLLLNQVPNSGMAVSHDLGDSLDVHPVRKKEIGERLARLALRNTYHKSIAANGPVTLLAEQKGNNIVVSFDFAKQLSTAGEKAVLGLELVNERGLHIPVNARIQKNKLMIPIPAGEKIKRVLYAWQPFTRANLMNEHELPASTFSLPVTFKQQQNKK